MRHLVCAAVLAIAAPASAQIDISGNWVSSQENLRPRGNAGIGDYTGLPLNDAGRLRADTWDASICRSASGRRSRTTRSTTQFRSAARIEKVLDPVTKQVVAYNLCCELATPIAPSGSTAGRTRPTTPSAPGKGSRPGVGGQHADRHDDAPATGLPRTQWRAGQPEEHGVEHFIRHGDQLTLVQFVIDPAYLEMPLIRSMDFVLNPVVTPVRGQSGSRSWTRFLTCRRGYVASYALVRRHTDWARFVGLPWEASRGGKATLFPEYLPTLRTDGQAYQAVLPPHRGRASHARWP